MFRMDIILKLKQNDKKIRNTQKLFRKERANVK